MAVSPYLCGLPILDTNGLPLNGAKVWVYAAGTTTPVSLYTNSGLTIAAANPIICPAGFVPMRFMATASYKIVVLKSDDSAVDAGYNADNIDPGVPIGSGALPIANGGTGATTAASARTALGAAAASALAAIESDISGLTAWTGLNASTYSNIASGTTAQRPVAADAGRIRYNTSLDRIERDSGSGWRSIPGSGEIERTDFISGFGQICLGRTRLVSGNITTINTTTPNDDTIPQISEGTQIFSQAFTPKSDSSVISIAAIVNGQQSGANEVILHLHQDGGADAIMANACGNAYGPYHLNHELNSVSTAAITFTLRAGTTAGNFLLNNGSSGNLGGLVRSELLITEWIAR